MGPALYNCTGAPFLRQEKSPFPDPKEQGRAPQSPACLVSCSEPCWPTGSRGGGLDLGRRRQVWRRPAGLCWPRRVAGSAQFGLPGQLPGAPPPGQLGGVSHLKHDSTAPTAATLPARQMPSCRFSLLSTNTLSERPRQPRPQAPFSLKCGGGGEMSIRQFHHFPPFCCFSLPDRNEVEGGGRGMRCVCFLFPVSAACLLPPSLPPTPAQTRGILSPPDRSAQAKPEHTTLPKEHKSELMGLGSQGSVGGQVEGGPCDGGPLSPQLSSLPFLTFSGNKPEAN